MLNACFLKKEMFMYLPHRTHNFRNGSTLFINNKAKEICFHVLKFILVDYQIN